MIRAPNTAPQELGSASLSKYTAALHAYLLKRLRRPKQDAADLTQEIFERFLRKRDQPEVIRNPLAYLYGIASHVVAESIEQEPRQLVTYDSTLAEHASETSPQTIDSSQQLGLRKDLVQALAQLPEAHLTALLLVEGDGLSCKEAARATGYSPNTIKTYLMQARATLKQLLEDYDGKKP
ncbi:RNA polymerase sigma factor [Steroidobacter sp.]|uniref:RNA polymerase sigma factor n=1 Tax=Steroidobacter sp. TaxID=1978227 RepID=UPI001A3AC38B|nr:RNA polymerase sigma factor [Steroidobacter sp.]MBL8269048.1 RNA polymerase sigma factor [Steroidobacter sp.]